MHVPFTQMRFPLQSVSFTHWACAVSHRSSARNASSETIDRVDMSCVLSPLLFYALFEQTLTLVPNGVVTDTQLVPGNLLVQSLAL